MKYTFEYDNPPGELSCSFWNADFNTDRMKLVEKYCKISDSIENKAELDDRFHSTLEQSNKLAEEIDSLINKQLPYLSKYEELYEDDLSEFTALKKFDLPFSLQFFAAEFERVSNLGLLQDKVEEMFIRYENGDLGFLSEERYKNFFQLPLSYSPEKKSYTVADNATLQSVLGLDILNIIESKYTIHDCTVCGSRYAVKGNYKSAACKKCRGKYAQIAYNKSVANNPIKATYNRYYQRYRKQRNSDKLSAGQFFEWCESSKKIRDQYSEKYAEDKNPDIIAEFEEKITLNH